MEALYLSSVVKVLAINQGGYFILKKTQYLWTSICGRWEVRDFVFQGDEDRHGEQYKHEEWTGDTQIRNYQKINSVSLIDKYITNNFFNKKLILF